MKPGSDRRLERLLAGLGVPDAADALSALDEEDARRYAGRGGAARRWWRSGQVLSIALWGLRDRVTGSGWSGGGGGFRPGAGLRAAVRSVRRDVATALTGALTLAIGFGAAASIFGVWRGFSRPLPVPQGEEVVRIRILDETRRPVTLTWGDVADLGEWSTLGGFGAVAEWSPVLAGDRTRVRRLSGARVSAQGLRLLGVSPAAGRLPGASETEAVVLSGAVVSGSWASAAAAIGDVVRLDGTPKVITAVMPSGFAFPFNHSVWVGLGPGDRELAVELFGRLRSGVTMETAAAEVATRLGPLVPPGSRVDVLGFTDARGEGGEKIALLAVLALVVVLLFVSCSNVSNLLLLRGFDRANQLAVHRALGASPIQVAWIVMVEAALIAALGAVAGLGVAWVTTGYIERSLSGHWGYYWMEVRVESDVLLFLTGLALATALVAGLLPAVRTWRVDVKGSLGVRESAGNVPRTGWVAPALLTVQVSLSFLFLLAAVLMARGLVTTARINSAFPAADTYVAGVTPGSGATGAVGADFREALLRTLTADARVSRAALTTGIPGLRASSRLLEQGGRAAEPGAPPVRLATYGVSPGFFDVLELAMVSGRPLEAGDMAGDANRVIVVDRSFARDELETLDAVGLRIGLRGPGADSVVSYEIVGVVEDIRIYRGAARDHSVFVPLDRDPSPTVFAMYRPVPGVADPRAVAGDVVSALRPDLPLDRGMTAGGADNAVPIEEILDYVRTVYTTAGRLGILGGAAAVVVAVLGLYGLLAYEMRRRRRELGIRIALGARGYSVAARVVRRGLLRVAPGLAIGVAVALATLPLLGVLLGGANARDVGLILIVVLAYAAITSVASLIPAIEAAGVDPNVTLREE